MMHEFKNRKLLTEAMTHSSANFNYSNERLEFLGDAILGMVITEQLYQRFPEGTEGDLSKIKSRTVSRAQCALIAKEIGLHKALIRGKGMKEIPNSALAGVVEALIGAIYLDGGLNAAKEFILIHFDYYEVNQVDYKSELQKLSQSRYRVTPIYEVLHETGPDHNKSFLVWVNVGHAVGQGKTKQEAEQHAARNAITILSHRN
jgi:ribonuclease III